MSKPNQFSPTFEDFEEIFMMGFNKGFDECEAQHAGTSEGCVNEIIVKRSFDKWKTEKAILEINQSLFNKKVMSKPNQFSPTLEEIEKIKAENKNLPPLERTCYKCGHKPCSGCVHWCDSMLDNISCSGNWEELDVEDVRENGEVWPPHACCQMQCSY